MTRFRTRLAGVRTNNSDGFSLIELVVSLAILGILMVILIMFMQTGGHLFGQVSNVTSQEMNSQTALAMMREYLVDCNGGIVISADHNTLIVTNMGENGAKDSTSGIPLGTVYTFVYVPDTADPERGKITIKKEVQDIHLANGYNHSDPSKEENDVLVDHIINTSGEPVFSAEFDGKGIRVELKLPNYTPPILHVYLRNECEVLQVP